jgi:hypothetical protein
MSRGRSRFLFVRARYDKGSSGYDGDETEDEFFHNDGFCGLAGETVQFAGHRQAINTTLFLTVVCCVTDWFALGRCSARKGRKKDVGPNKQNTEKTSMFQAEICQLFFATSRHLRSDSKPGSNSAGHCSRAR